jgi:DNA polymerase-3 subunit alpha
MGGRDIMFIDQFTRYDKCAPAGVLLPKIKIDKKFYKQLNLNESVDNLKFLKTLCWESMKEMGINKLPNKKDYYERAGMELKILSELGFIDYILLNWDILNFCHENGIPTGPGRGSAAGSLILFLLKVTKVDPIKYNLFFERFVSKSRAKKIEKDGITYLDGSLLADVDNDIAYDRRAEVIEYIKRKHPSRTCRILNLVSLSGKLCVKETGKIVGLYSEQEVNDVSDWIPVKFGKVSPLSEARAESELFEEWCEDNPKVYEIARKLEGLIKNTGIHASGIAISHHKLTDICPIQKTKEGELTSCYDMNWIAELTVKFDILGLKTLTVLKEAANLTGVSLDDIDLKQDALYKHLQNLECPQGLFQIEADTNFGACKKIKPRNLEEVSGVIAIARPGALEFKDQYAEYVRTGNSELVHPEFAEILNSTGGIPLYQEQLMQMAVKVGFTLDEAEQLRRIVGKKKVDQMPEWQSKIRDMVEKNRLTNAWSGHKGTEIADVLWQVAEDSANYSFNKSHSISYAILSAWTTYMKFNHPQHFYIALLKMAKHEADPFDQVNKIARELNFFDIKLLPPDLAKSQMDFCVEGKDIRYGLNCIKGVSEKSLQSIIDFRESEISNKFDVFLAAKDAKINIGVLSALIQAGALNSFGNSRSRMVLEAQSFNLLTDREKRNFIELGTKHKFDVLNILNQEVFVNKTVGDDNRPLMKDSRVQTFLKKYRPYKNIYDQNKTHEKFANWYFENQLLGYSYTHTLKEVFKNESRNLMNCYEVCSTERDERVKFVGVIRDRTRKLTSRNNKKYIRLNISDELGKIDCLFFEPKLDRFLEEKNMPEKDNIVTVVGKKSDDIVFVDDMSVLDGDIYMKLSDVK